MDGPKSSLDHAIEDALAAYAGTVRAMAHRHRLSPSDLDEIFQEMRIRLWNARTRGERIGAMKPSYVYQMARSAAIDVIRRTRHSTEKTLGDTGERGEAWGHPAERTDGMAVNTELESQVRAALAALPESRRVVVQMHLAGYGQQEITEMLGWTSGKVRNLLSRGLGDLRDWLAVRGVAPVTSP